MVQQCHIFHFSLTITCKIVFDLLHSLNLIIFLFYSSSHLTKTESKGLVPVFACFTLA